ncbi:hypothetical protein [Streptomyces sp. G45]|uniref:hypothetical protein n=1 Tax=Streptomyces sp. G45 TaxID=3406627 RepID=UPI003C1BD712
MTPARKAAALAAIALALTACGIRDTGVVSGARPATGLTRDLRLYFVHGGGLQGVTRPGQEIQATGGVIKLLMEPSPEEQERGLTSLVELGSWEVTGEGTRITLRSPQLRGVTEKERLMHGQLVCTLARTQAYVHRKERMRPDDVQVTLAGPEERLGPYRCAQFLTG